MLIIMSIVNKMQGAKKQIDNDNLFSGNACLGDLICG